MIKFKIAIVTPYGAEERLDHFSEFILAQGLNKLGHNIQFYTYKINSKPNYQKNSIYKGIKIFRCRQRLGIAPSLFFSISKFKPQVVMYFHPKSYLSFSAYLAGKMVGAKIISEIVGILHDPFIVSNTDDPINNFKQNINLITSWKKLFKSILKGKIVDSWKNFICHMPIAKADAIVAISKNEQMYIQKFYKRKSTIIAEGIPNNALEKQHKPLGKIPKEYLLFIGQIKKRKGWDTVTEALTILKQKGIKKNLVFICPTKNINEAKKYIKKFRVENQIFFFCQVSNQEKNWLYNHCQYVLTPSRYESFGLPVFEALQAGKPLLATDIAVYLEFLEHKKNALISQAGNAKELAKNIKILDNDPKLCSKLVNSGYKTAGQFSDKTMINKFLDLIMSYTTPLEL